jgi:hypothetical protein
VIPKKNWNSAVGRSRATPLALIDETGVTNGAVLIWHSDNNWKLPGTGTPGNMHMMRRLSGYWERKPDDRNGCGIAFLARGL